jgi:hypothetical protein
MSRTNALAYFAAAPITKQKKNVFMILIDWQMCRKKDATTISITTLGITTLSIMTLSITTLRRMDLTVAFRTSDCKQSNTEHKHEVLLY